jgi:hypothetical protein
LGGEGRKEEKGGKEKGGEQEGRRRDERRPYKESLLLSCPLRYK